MDPYVLFLITTGRQKLDELCRAASMLEPGLADALHLREKELGARELLRWYEELGRAAPQLPVYINDRLDTALAVGAPGVQLGYSSLPTVVARRILPAGARIGVSVHSPEEAAAAEESGADYVLFGHIYATASKEGLAPRGTEALRRVVEATSLPVVAIGGIRPDNTADVLATGCAGIAVLSGVLLHEDPPGQLRHYRETMQSSGYMPRSPWKR